MRLLVLIGLLFSANVAIDGFSYCSSWDQLYTLWPDWNDHTSFIQCITLHIYGRHTCPEPLLFGFEQQVCVWQYQWQPPPGPDEILNITSTTRAPTLPPSSTTQIVTDEPGTTTQTLTDEPGTTTQPLTDEPGTTTQPLTDEPGTTTQLLTDEPGTTTLYEEPLTVTPDENTPPTISINTGPITMPTTLGTPPTPDQTDSTTVGPNTPPTPSMTTIIKTTELVKTTEEPTTIEEITTETTEEPTTTVENTTLEPTTEGYTGSTLPDIPPTPSNRMKKLIDKFIPLPLLHLIE